MAWRQQDIPGGTLDLFEPSAATGSGGLLFLPGHSGKTLASSAEWTRELEFVGMRAACPVVGCGWWVDAAPRIRGKTPIEWLQADLVPTLKEVWQCDSRAISLGGVSLGGQAALQLAYRFPRDYPRVVAISPAIDFHLLYGLGLPMDSWYESAESARQHTAPLNLHPLAWPPHQLITCDRDDTEWFESSQRLASKLTSSGIPHTTRFEALGLGHTWSYFNTQAHTAITALHSWGQTLMGD